MSHDLTPPGWGETSALEVVLGRVPDEYTAVRYWRYDPDGVESVEVDIWDSPRGAPIPNDATVALHIGGTKSKVIADLLAWLNGERS